MHLAHEAIAKDADAHPFDGQRLIVDGGESLWSHDRPPLPCYL